MKTNKLMCLAMGMMAIAACNKEQLPVENEMPQTPTYYTIPVHVSAGAGDTKAYYGDKDGDVYPVIWEENDKLLALKGITATPSSKGTITDYASTLTISGIRGSRADFEGEVTTQAPDASAKWYYVFPASEDVTLETTVTKEGLTSTVTRKTTVSIPVPAQQDGRWIPFACAISDESYVGTETQSIQFNPLTACIAIRTYAADKTTPKAVKTIKVQSATNNLTGSYKGTFQGSAPASTEMAADLDFAGEGKIISLSGLEAITADAEGVYEYRINIPAGVNFGDLEVVISDGESDDILRTIPGKEMGFSAGKKYTYKTSWDAEIVDNTEVSFTLTAQPKTSYSYYAGLNGVEVNKTKANTMKGLGVEAGAFEMSVTSNLTLDIIEYGYYINDQIYPVSSEATTATSFAGTVAIDDFTEVGSYDCNIKGYIKTNASDGRTKIYTSETPVAVTLIASGLPYEMDFRTNNTVDKAKAAGWSVYGTVGAQSSQLYIANTNKYGYIVSPAFYVPAATGIHIEFLQKFYATASSSIKSYVEACSSNSYKAAANEQTVSSSNNTSADSGRRTNTYDIQLDETNKYVSISCKDYSTRLAISAYYYVHNFKVTYR